MSSHLTSAILGLPSQVYGNSNFAVKLNCASDGTAVTIESDVNSVSNAQAGNYQDIGGPNDSIVGLVVPASGMVTGQFPMTIDGDSSPDPLNVPVSLTVLTSDGFQVAASNNGQTITVVSPNNVDSLPGAPAGTPVAIEATSSSAAVTYQAAVAGSGSAFDGSSTAITGYVVQCDQTGSRSTASLNLQSIFSPAHSAWSAITTSASIKINGGPKISLGTSGTPTVAAAVSAINGAAIAGVTVYAIGSGTTETFLIVSTGAAIVLTDGGDNTNGLAVLGYAGPPASVTAANGPAAVITGLPSTKVTFHVFAQSALGNGPFCAQTAAITLS